MGGIAAAVIVVFFLIGIIGYFVVRGRQPGPPPEANSQARGAEPPRQDEDTVPRDPDGMPMVTPGDPAAEDADQMQQRARAHDDRPPEP